jgi:hypothetical protein
MQIGSGIQDVVNVSVRGENVPVLVAEHVNVHQRDAPLVRDP